MAPFEPLFRNRHLATISANFWPRDFSREPYPERLTLIETEPEVKVLACEQEPKGTPSAQTILLHGLEGSHCSGYMISMAHALLRAGHRVIRLNMRTCGGSDAHCRTLYHAGLTSDLRVIVDRLAAEASIPIFVVGFSLGGNVVLKFAGESGRKIANRVAGVAAISTPIDLAACCRQMMRFENRIYENRFVGRLKSRYRGRHRQFPDLFPIDGIDRVRSVYEFDDRFTAKHFGFGDAENYYRTQSSAGFLDGIAVPAFVVQAQDDPLIPFEVFRNEALQANANIRLMVTRHGGHVGFLSRAAPRFWLDEIVRDWMAEERNKAGHLAVSC